MNKGTRLLLVIGLWLAAEAGIVFVIRLPRYNITYIDTRPPSLSVPSEDYGWQWRVPEVQPPADHPPSVVTVSGATYHIRYGDADFMSEHGVAGFTDPGTQLIYLNPDEENVRACVVHELLHVMFRQADEWYKFEGRWEEKTSSASPGHSWITPISPVLLKFVQDNPRMVKWLASEPTKPKVQFFDIRSSFVYIQAGKETNN